MWLMAVAVMVVACSEDEGAPVTPSFPEEEQILSVKAGESVDLVFEASMDWKLYSSTLWCRFSNGMTSISGQAGKQAVQVSVNEEMLSYGEMQAEITLKQGDMEKVIAKLTRQGEGLWVTDANGNYFSEENLIPFFYREIGKGVDINFTTNYDWTVEEYPEWLVVNEAPLKGLGFRPGNISVTVKNEFSAFAKKGDIKVKRTGTDDFVNIPVNFYGIDRVSSDKNAWGGWTFNSDGGKYSTSNSMTGESDEFDAPLVMQNVLVNGNDYEVLYFEDFSNNQYRLMGDDSKWINATIESNEGVENKTAKVSVMENSTSKKRKGAILVIPTDTLNMIGRDNLLTADNDFTEAAGKYVLIGLEQKSNLNLTDEFMVDCGESTPVAFSKIENPDLSLIEKYGTDKIYECELPSGVAYDTFIITSSEMYQPYYSWNQNFPWPGVNVDYTSIMTSFSLTGITEKSGTEIDPETQQLVEPLSVMIMYYTSTGMEDMVVLLIKREIK